MPAAPVSPLIAVTKSAAVLFSLPGIDFHTSKADLPSSPFSPFSPLIAVAKSAADLFSLPGMDFHTSKADLPSSPFSPFKDAKYSASVLSAFPSCAFHTS